MKREQLLFRMDKLSTLALAIILFFSAFTFSEIVSDSSPKNPRNNSALVILYRHSSKRSISYDQWTARCSEHKMLPHIVRREMSDRQSLFSRLVITRLHSFENVSVDPTIKFFQRKTLPVTGSEDFLETPRG